jgi:Pyruvate/2-oxoacid:ferredoxin oxidoreductase gamma subunit
MDNVEARIPKAVYANHFHVGHNAFEFVLEFGVAAPEDAHPEMHTRIITSPALAGAFAGLLEQALQEYETEYQTRLPRATSPGGDRPEEG